jgi:hypothetical protein
MRTRHLVGGSLAASLLLSIALAPIALAPPAAAGGGSTTIQVTTTDDELDPSPTVPGSDVSLREAMAFSGTGDLSHDIAVVLQVDQTYVLDLCSGSSDANATGDLHAPASVSFTIVGNGSTVEQTCADQAVIRKPLGNGRLIIDDLHVTGGERNGVSASQDLYIVDGSVIEGNSSDVAGGGVYASDDLIVHDSTLRDNVANNAGGGGFANTTISVSRSTITGNRSGTGGGGLFTHGTALVDRSTVSDNATGTAGGGIGAFHTIQVTSSTVARNRAGTSGGGIGMLSTLDADTLSVSDSTLVGNAAVTGANLHSDDDGTIARSIVSLGSGGSDCHLVAGGLLPNLVGGDESCYGILQPLDEMSLHPMVAAPASNGGPTRTQRTVSPSRALDAIPTTGTPGVCATPTDQRLEARPQGPACDAGAFEGLPTTCAPTFDDVTGSHPFFDEICWLTQLGVTGGFADGGYHPSDAVSRQAMAAFLYRLALSPPVEATQAVALDVPLGHPFLREIHWLLEEDIAEGFGDETYRPLTPVSRQAMAAFLYRVAGEPNPPSMPAQTFSDVPVSHPFFEEIAWMTDADVARGFEDGTFRPSAPVSRQAMAAFLLRMADQVPLLGL